MISTLTIVRYPRYLGWAGFLSMALFRIPLLFNRNISFWKLLGCGKNGTFDKTPDLRQWGVWRVWKTNPPSNNDSDFICQWWKFFGCEIWCLTLQAIEGHGTWDGKKCFGELPKQTAYEGKIAVLTRATIRFSKLGQFWKNVDGVANIMRTSNGFITSLGIGELPWIKQATFSVWESKEAMKQFAYNMREHAEVIRKTRQENWYSEDMFVRFIILHSEGSLHGVNPLQGKL